MLTFKLNRWLFFNHFCSLCRQPHTGPQSLCTGCSDDLPYLRAACPRCALAGVSTLCSDCLEYPPAFRQTRAIFTYRFPLPQMIHRIKSGRDPEPIHWLAQVAADQLKPHFSNNSVLVPVPMHPADLILRGFNQSEVFARALSRRFNANVRSDLLIKQHRSPHQAALSRSERLENLKHCFRVSGDLPESITLIDDVMTTGTTIRRLSELLLSAGCQKIDVLVLCRTQAD